MNRRPLTPAEVLNIRALWDANKHTARGIAAMYGCAAETIARIGRRETWAWLPEGEPSPPSAEEAAASLNRLMEELANKPDEGEKA